MTMEILSNFASIYCYISFVIGAVFMLAMLSIAAMGKVKEPRNKVHFYVKREHGNHFTLWVGKTISSSYFVFADYFFKEFNLNPDDFADMKVGEIREVYLDLED